MTTKGDKLPITLTDLLLGLILLVLTVALFAGWNIS